MICMTIDQAMAMCMSCSHCDKPAMYISLRGDSVKMPKYCEEHAPWKEESEPKGESSVR